MKIAGRAVIHVALGGLLLVVPGCTALNALDEVLLPSGNGNALVSGEIRSIDTRRGRLEIRDQNSNRNQTVQYDTRTRVVYRSRQYPASSLERGDMVRARISYDRSGNAWADLVEVRESAQDRRTSNSRVQRLDGVVRQVDTRRGLFTIEPNRARPVVVHVPRGVSSGDARRFDRLRRGDRIRVDVRPVNSNAAELVRFR
jgi:hypothetical protein